MSNEKRHDVGEDDAQRREREQKAEEGVKGLAAGLEEERVDRAVGDKAVRKEVAAEVEGTREQVASDLEAERERVAAIVEADRQNLAVVTEGRMRGLIRRNLTLMAALLVALVGVTWYDGSEEAQRDAAQQAHNRAVVIDAIQANCKKDEKFRTQYKVRGKAEKQLFEFFLTLAAQPPQPGATAQEQLNAEKFTQKFAPLTEKIHLIPIPDCDGVAAEIERQLVGE